MEPEQEYREAVMAIGRSGYTVLSPVDREALELILKRTGLSLKDAAAIEDEVLSAFRRYEKLMIEQGIKQYPLNEYAKNQLNKLQQILNMTDTDISELRNYIAIFLASQTKLKYVTWGGCLTVLGGIVSLFLFPLIMSLRLNFLPLGSLSPLFGFLMIAIFLGFIIFFVVGNSWASTYESYMEMRYGENWKA